MKPALVIILLFVFVMFVFAIVANMPTFFTAVKGATSSILLTGDGGETWFSLEQQEGAEELERASITTLSYHPDDSQVVYAGTEGRGLYRSIDSGAAWQKVVDTNNALSPNATVYGVGFGPAFADRDQGQVEVFYLAVSQQDIGQILRTTNGGFTFEAVYTTAARDGAIYFVVADPANPAVLWAGTSEGLLVRSLDSGETWQRIHSFSTAPYALVRNNNELLVTTLNGRLHVSNASGETWQELNPAFPKGRSGRIFGITQDPLVSSTVYMTTDAGVLRSDNFGRSWQEIPLTVPEEELPVRMVAVSPVARNVLFVAAGRNMYITSDAGTTWRVRHLALRRQVSAIAPHPSNPAFILVGTQK